MRFPHLLAALALCSTCLGAHADTITVNFKFSGPSDSGNGTIVASSTGTVGEYAVSSITGTVDGASIDMLLAEASYPSMFPPENDNLLFYPGTGPFVDEGGIGVKLANGTQGNLWYGSSALSYQLTKGTAQTTDSITSFTVSAPTSAVTPEPASLLLLATGLAAAVGLRRRILI